MGTTSRAINSADAVLEITRKTVKMIENCDLSELHTAFMHINSSDLEDFKKAINSDGDTLELMGKSAMLLIYRYFQNLVIDEMENEVADETFLKSQKKESE